MDGSTVDHSDSDSGESWTLLENQPAYGDDAPDFPESSPTSFERDPVENHLDKDEDTDGISIISDSDPESSPCEITCDNFPTQSHDIPNLLNAPQTPNKKTIESLCNEDDFLGDGSHKLKTYVHRRNKRLSMVLNIIMLGSVITAAGVAIGHMWGAKNECTVPTPSVNKILSNLYKLQEENAYLRNKLKQMTVLADSMSETQQPIANKGNKPSRQQRCKKVFEGPLSNKVGKALKCVDPEKEPVKNLDNSGLLRHEKEFLNDISKLQNVYNQNKSWLDKQIHRRLDNEKILRNKRNIKDVDDVKEKILNKDGKKVSTIENNSEKHDASNLPNMDFRIPESGRTKSHKAWNLRKQIGSTKKFDKKINKEHEQGVKNLSESKKSHKVIVNLEMKNEPQNFEEISSTESFFNVNNGHEDVNLQEASKLQEKKVSYADSLKTDSESSKVPSQLNNSNDLPLRGMRGHGHIRRHGDVDMLSNLISSSEEDIIKDDRYTGPKMKRDKKKHDRHKINKKQKRKNKYEQWEMKGGYMKDFDEFSMTSSQINLGNDIIINPERKYFNNDFENYLNKLSDAEDFKKPKDEKNTDKKGEKGKKAKNLEWYDKRYALRAEARRKLEHELFGETSPNNAAWYFRRMNKREQCRAQKDNSTSKKLSKQKMNYKMKH